MTGTPTAGYRAGFPRWLTKVLTPCPAECGCILTDDADRHDCGCDGPCTTEKWPLWTGAPIPEVEVVPPLCPLCQAETRTEDGGFECDRCRVSWPNHYSTGRPTDG